MYLSFYKDTTIIQIHGLEVMVRMNEQRKSEMGLSLVNLLFRNFLNKNEIIHFCNGKKQTREALNCRAVKRISYH